MAFWRRPKDGPERAETEPAATEGGPAAGGRPSAAVAGDQPAASVDPHQRIDGLRAWLAQVERKVGIRTYALGAAAVLGLAAGIVAIVLALGLEEDSAKQEDLRDLRKQITAVEVRAEEQAEQGAQSVTERINQLEADLARLSDAQTRTEDELAVVQDDIADLRNEVSQLDGGGSGGSGNP